MKITEETKIKNLISEDHDFMKADYEIEDSNMTNYGFNGEIILISVHCRQKAKSFEDYLKEYWGKWLMIPSYDEMLMKDKFGLLWHIIKDKGGDFEWFYLLIEAMYEGYDGLVRENDIESVWEILPDPFIESFKL